MPEKAVTAGKDPDPAAGKAQTEQAQSGAAQSAAQSGSAQSGSPQSGATQSGAVQPGREGAPATQGAKGTGQQAAQGSAIEMLKEDHRKVEELFEQYGRARGRKKDAIIEQVCSALT